MEYLLKIEEYHGRLMASDPPVLQFIKDFLNSGEANFMHIALWITSHFSSVASE